MTKLLLVDGSSYLYRAFHALPDLRTKSGQPTGAIRGVLSMLKNLEGQYQSDYLACVFDAKGKTFRDDWYPEYKANRPSMPDDLRAQIEPLHEAIRAEGWPLLSISGVEADDVIGTLSEYAVGQGWEVIISTGDKDLTQLVKPGVTWVNTMSNEALDEDGVREKFGVPPALIVDYLTLVGDTVDNVPGVAKCGPKTAVKWLEEFGSLDGVVTHADKMPGKIGENLRAHLDFLPLGKRLVTVKTDVELPLAVTELRRKDPDKTQLAELYKTLEFRGWLQKLGDGELDTKTASPEQSTSSEDIINTDNTPPASEADATARLQNYRLITDKAAFNALLGKLMGAEFCAFDTETDSLEPMQARLVGMSFSTAAGEGYYLPVAHNTGEQQLDFADTLAQLKPWFTSSSHKKIGQNIKYDMHVLANCGIALAGIVDDTMLQSYILESDKSHTMDSLASRHLGIKTIAFTEVCGKGAKQISFADVALASAGEYAAEDADITFRLWQHFRIQLSASPSLQTLYETIEMPSMHVLFRMEREGILIDTFALASQSNELSQKLYELENKAYELVGRKFNLASPKQLGEILFDELQLPTIKKTATGQASTDEEVLSRLAEDYPLPQLLLEHRGLAKLKNTYTDKLPRMQNPQTGRVHTSFSQATAITGRLASTEPNLQNIPIKSEEGRRVRSAFIADKGFLIVSADYSQIELRIMAHLSGDPGLQKAFAEKRDVHRATAAEIFGITVDAVNNEQRRYAKVINFGLIYGMSAHGLAKNLGIERGAAANYIERYFNRYPGVAAYMENTRELARKQHYVETVFGRRLYLPEISSRNAGRRQGAERAAINAPMQGTAADLIKKSMIVVGQYLQQHQCKSRLLLQVHDELVLEVPTDELAEIRQRVPELMAQVAQLSVPLVAEIGNGNNWDEAH